MKLATLQIGNDVIEAHNNMWTGVETVYFNGQVVSKAFNWFHGVHKFSVLAEDGMAYDHYRVDFRFSFNAAAAVAIDVFRNGECILDQSGTNSRYRKVVTSQSSESTCGTRDYLELRQLDRSPLYREEDLV